MGLAKSDMAIASRYAALVKDEALRNKIFPRIKGEWEKTVESLLAITGNAELLDGNPLLKRSIKNRFPYLDPLNHVQVELLHRFREVGGNASEPYSAEDDRVRRGVLLSINGIAGGLRNSG
jgi:phosphoenolpyruvate carboxylase